jgi:hypothetical protein
VAHVDAVRTTGDGTTGRDARAGGGDANTASRAQSVVPPMGAVVIAATAGSRLDGFRRTRSSGCCSNASPA